MRLRVVVMIIPWLILFFAGMRIEGAINKTPANPNFVVFRELLQQPASADDLNTLVKLEIADVRAPSGDPIMPGQPWTIISPGDTVTISLTMTENGHVASFSLQDPSSLQTLSRTNPTTKGSEVVSGAELTIQIPAEAGSAAEIRLPWEAETYLIRKVESTSAGNTLTRWFDLVLEVPLSGTAAIPLAADEQRDEWLASGVNVQGPRFLRFLCLAALLTAILLVVRKHFLSLVSVSMLFAGAAILFLLDITSRGPKGGQYFALSIAVVVSVCLILIALLRRFHATTIASLFNPGT